MKRAFHELHGPYPFAESGRAFFTGMPYLGGEIAILPAGAANANLVLAHHLRAVPRCAVVLDVGTNAALATPFPRGTTAWSAASVSFAVPLLSAPVVVHLR